MRLNKNMTKTKNEIAETEMLRLPNLYNIFEQQ